MKVLVLAVVVVVLGGATLLRQEGEKPQEKKPQEKGPSAKELLGVIGKQQKELEEQRKIMVQLVKELRESNGEIQNRLAMLTEVQRLGLEDLRLTLVDQEAARDKKVEKWITQLGESVAETAAGLDKRLKTLDSRFSKPSVVGRFFQGAFVRPVLSNGAFGPQNSKYR